MDLLVNNKRLEGKIEAIASKSYAQRAIFMSLLAKGTSYIKINRLSDDIRVALGLAKSLGAKIKEKEGTYEIEGPMTFPNKAVLDVGESGTSLRLILSILVSLGIDSQIIRRGSLVARTNSELFNLFREKNIEVKEDKERIFIKGSLEAGVYRIRGDISSQFVTSLLIGLANLKGQSEIILTSPLESKPYVDMTIDLMGKFSVKVYEIDGGYLVKDTYKPSIYECEGDWSNALFYLVSGCKVTGLDYDSFQGDKRAIEFLKDLGYSFKTDDGAYLLKNNQAKEYRVIDAKNMPDTVPILSLASLREKGITRVINTKRLKLKESDRVDTTCQMLRALGAEVEVGEEYFAFLSPKNLRSGIINSFNDHRIAMTAAIAGTFADGPIKIMNAECVKKSYEGFFEDFYKVGGEFYVL